MFYSTGPSNMQNNKCTKYILISVRLMIWPAKLIFANTAIKNKILLARHFINAKVVLSPRAFFTDST